MRGGNGRMPKFNLEYWEDDGWLIGRLIEVPGVFSQGETLEELKDNINDSYKLMTESEPLDLVPENSTVLELSF
jgi:predicted RNase H-like HicB family nuclease